MKSYALLTLTLLTGQVSAALYQLPFKGENFGDNEKLYTRDHAQSTSQKHGYDISGRRYDFVNDRWTSVTTDLDTYYDSPTNDKHVIYNKSIYASRAGKIIGCWRNAPENPRPKLSGDSSRTRPWLHQSLKDGLMPGGGNMIWVEHSDGTRALYAHMIPGSISSRLCPHSDRLFPAPKKSTEFEYIAVAEDQQISVSAGQYLGRVGNSGNSTGPHLHVHVDKDGTGQLMTFKRGISSPMDNAKPYGSWTRFAGSPITPGPVLVWPPRTVGKEYTRHAFKQVAFQALFDHLADSGFKPKWLDGYAVNNDVRYNMIWVPADTHWRGYFGQSSAGYQTAFDQAANDGYSPIHVDSHQTSAGTRYSVIFEQNNQAALARHGIDYNTHIQVMNQAKGLGLNPVSISVVSANNQRRYTVLYRDLHLGAWSIRSQISAASYQNTYDDMSDANKKPYYLNAYTHNGQVYYTSVFASEPGLPTAARHGQTAAELQTSFNLWTGQGFNTHLISGIDGYFAHRFASIWHKP